MKQTENKEIHSLSGKRLRQNHLISFPNVCVDFLGKLVSNEDAFLQ